MDDKARASFSLSTLLFCNELSISHQYKDIVMRGDICDFIGILNKTVYDEFRCNADEEGSKYRKKTCKVLI